MDKSEFSFKPSLSIINVFRGFQQENHEYASKFLDQLAYHLFALKDKFPNLSALNQKNPNLNIDQLLLIVHFYFASIANLEEFVKTIDEKVQIVSLSKSHVNKTNILNVHAICDSLEAKKIKQISQIEEKSEFLNYQFALMNLPEDKKMSFISKECLALDLDLVNKSSGFIFRFKISCINW